MMKKRIFLKKTHYYYFILNVDFNEKLEFTKKNYAFFSI